MSREYIGQMEAIELCVSEINTLNSRIKAGEELIQDCKDQLRMLRQKRSYLLQCKEACENGNYDKLVKLGYSLEASTPSPSQPIKH
jgi:hypothetical protein